MNEPMTIKDLKPRMIIRRDVDGEVLDLFVCDIEVSDGQISGSVWRVPGRFGEPHTFWVRPEEELEVYTTQGARLYPGMSKAEIAVREVEVRAKAAGLKPEVEIEENERYIQVHIRIPGKTMFHETIHATWLTSVTGRRTTRYGWGFEIRGALRSKKYKRSATVKLSKTEFFQQLGHLCFTHEYQERTR